MSLWLAITIAIGELVAFVVLMLLFHERGWRRGFARGRDEGYAAGRVAADNWWIGTEQGAGQARRQMWMEEKSE